MLGSLALLPLIGTDFCHLPTTQPSGSENIEESVNFLIPRSYYINRWRSLHLTTVHETDMLKRKEEEVAEAEVLRDSMSREVNEVKRESARLGKCISDVERNLSTAKSNILKSKAQLKKKEQERDVAGDQNESERLELKMEDTRKTLESLMEDQRNIDTESEQVDESFKELAAKKASSHAKTAEITEKALLLRQKKDKLDAKCKAFASKLLSNNDDLRILDEDLASQVDLLNSCKADLQTLELKARELSEGTELVPEDSLAKLEAKMEALVKEKLERGETDYGAAARARYIELSSQVSLKVQKIDNLKQFSRSLENQMGSRRVLFQTLRDKVVDMVERRFSILAGQTMATMQLRLNIDPSKKQLSFRFGPEQRSSKVNNFPPLDKTFLVFFSRKTRCLFAGWVSLWRRKVVQSTMPYSLSLAFHDHALQVRSSRRMT